MIWWPFRRRNGRAAARETERDASAKLREAKRETPYVARRAREQDLSDAEFVSRVAELFKPRPT